MTQRQVWSVSVVLFALATRAYSEIPVDNMALYFSFDDVAGNTVRDLSPEANDGTLQNGAEVVGGGVYGNAIQLNGVDSYVRVPTDNSLMLEDAVTIAAWAKYDNGGGVWQCILTNGVQSGPWENYGLFINKDGKYLYFTILLNGAHTVHSSPAQPDIVPDSWLHVAASYDSTTARIYLNGVQIHEQARGGAMTTHDTELRVGDRQNSGTVFSGVMDEVALFNVALSEAQINDVMNAEIAVALAVEPRGKAATTWASLKR